MPDISLTLFDKLEIEVNDLQESLEGPDADQAPESFLEYVREMAGKILTLANQLTVSDFEEQYDVDSEPDAIDGEIVL